MAERMEDTLPPKSEKLLEIHNKATQAVSVQEFVDKDENFNESYGNVKKIDEGSYGSVYSAQWKGESKTFLKFLALKVVEASKFQDTEIERNLELFQNGSCRHIVRFISLRSHIFEKQKFYVLEMEICTGGTLRKSDHEDKYDNHEFQLNILKGLIEGLKYIHSLNLVHHDIHGGNIFFKSEDDPTVMYGDFGLTKEEATYTKWDDIERLADTIIRYVFALKSSGSLQIQEIATRLREKEVSKSIIDVIVGLKRKEMKLEEAKDKIEEMIRKLPGEGDDRIDDRTALSASEPPCSSSRSGLRRRETKQEDENHIQKRRKVDQIQMELKVNGNEILFDYLSRKLSGSSPLEFCVILLGDTTVVECCKTKYNPEIFYKIMHSWKCERPELDHVEELKKALSKLGRQDLVEHISSFSVESLQKHSITIEGPNIRVVDDDFIRISRNVAQGYVHVVRFLGLQQNDIDQLESDFSSSIKERIFEAFKKIKYNFPSLNRQHVCNALHYADHVNVIFLLNENWKNS
ncbi:probable serine/threonine-protein kinase zyg-1 [Saccostrea echinata]|uniref:probable serine/threonine-protein kinase zyg-1 n=1 Tax=Saccostrea echinata TaxID=191078 RepID=UPI002A812A9F|nr:probable serine/threonine-protein kinase zyg-1 [Saccostrea echinata]